jgi:hypothetical protein
VVRNDNSGPHTPEEIAKIYADLKSRFPQGQIEACGLTEFANAVAPHRTALPVVTEEIGDSWIHGIASDPLKVARYREVARLRQAWIAQGKFRMGDAVDVQLLRHVLLEAEHTWGPLHSAGSDSDAGHEELQGGGVQLGGEAQGSV